MGKTEGSSETELNEEEKVDSSLDIESLKGMKISELKKELNKLNKNKEDWFKKKEELKKEVADVIAKIKEASTNTAELGKKVAEFKDKRDKLNAKVKELIIKIKELNKRKDEQLSKIKFKGSPEQIKVRIEQLEERLETSACSFDKEKKLMKEINGLKKQLSSLGNVKPLFDEIDKLSKEIDETKKKSDNFHERVKEFAKAKKKASTDFRKYSNLITGLKKDQADAFDKFIEFKQEFAKVNKLLQDKLKLLKEDNELKREKKIYEQQKKKEKIEQELKKKASEVKEKLKSKKVLTTEDLLAFQSIDEDL